MLEHEEIERARPMRSTTIELEDFVELKDIDPVYFEKTYYLAPRRDAAKPYALLLRTLERTGRVGIGRFVLRTKPHLVAVRAAAGAIALETLYFGDEVRATSDVAPAIDDATATDRELRVAEQLVEMLATSWDPDTLLRRVSRGTAPHHLREGSRRRTRCCRGAGADAGDAAGRGIDGSAQAERRGGEGEEERHARDPPGRLTTTHPRSRYDAIRAGPGFGAPIVAPVSGRSRSCVVFGSLHLQQVD